MVGPPAADHCQRARPAARAGSIAVASTRGSARASTAATAAATSSALRRGTTESESATTASATADKISGSSAVTTTCGKVAEVDLRLLPQQQLKVTPKQIAANYILQLSSLELQDVINQELEENPALDLEEVQVCPLCGGELQGRVCVRCFGTGSKPTHTPYSQEDEPLEGTNLMARDDDDEEFDPIARAEAETTLGEYLTWNVRVLLPKRLHK